MIESINTKEAPDAVGPYSQAVRIGNLIFTSGQIAIDPVTGNFNNGSILEQTHQVLANLQKVLDSAGSSFTKVVKVTVYLDDIGNFSEFNAIYEKYFPENPPARTTVEVSAIALSAKIEIDMIASL